MAVSRAFCHARHRLAVAFAFLDFFEYHLGHIELAMQVVVEFFLCKVAYELGYGHAVRRHLARAELVFVCDSNTGILHAYGDGSHHAVANVGVLEIAVEVFLERAAPQPLERAWCVPPCVVCCPLTKE